MVTARPLRASAVARVRRWYSRLELFLAAITDPKHELHRELGKLAKRRAVAKAGFVKGRGPHQ
jgi:hypothetical protein